jgi:SpoVK/Ycf46/Vps4 family AAA+-type ATPase
MPSPQRQPAVPSQQAAQSWLPRIRRVVAAAPTPVKILVVAAVLFFAAPLISVAVLVAFCYTPYALFSGQRTVLASVCTALWGIVAVAAVLSGRAESGYLLALPVVVTAASHLGALARWQVPCRTVAWTLLWALPVGIVALRYWHSQPVLGLAMAWAIALMVLGWRFAKALQDSRESRRSAGGSALAAPYALAAAGPAAATAAAPASPPARTELSPSARPVRAAQPDSGPRSGVGGRPGGSAGPPADAEWAHITVDEAMAELTGMIGLAAVKDQVRSITASVEAARRRSVAGHAAEKPMQHLVFLGPPGTGKTAVARVVAKIFYAFGLLDSPSVVEAQRADLVGEYLGATAIRTNRLVDSALGKVLFIDEAYSLVNDGDGQGDRFGHEAVQALVKRAEDDRERLIIILAGYERQMESFLAANSGLNSRFGVRVKFPTYSATELQALADKFVRVSDELLDPGAGPVLSEILDEVSQRRLTDELGNGRFVRSLLAMAGQQRDVRVLADGGEPTPAELVTLRGEDLQRAYGDLTSRFRGYGKTPTVEGALAELDALVGLEPVKRQVREIVAQLQVARLRDRQGLTSQPPLRHFVFTGPPGTGKTTVARIVGRIFAALGLLVRPEVIEAQRADLVGEHLGATAIKTSRLIDSALGGVLFIDEAYALHNEGYSGGDAFGAEAVATLLKRAEDDRDQLVIVLAGYTADMERLLRSNPGLASRFSTRIAFPSYTAAQLAEITRSIASRAGDTFDPAALPVLDSVFAQAAAENRIDALGNGRFARTLFERACASRAVRVSTHGEAATAAELTTVLASDVQAAYRELAG